MGNPVCVTGASMSCTFGTAPSSFISLGLSLTTAGKLPAGIVTDIIPIANIPPFAMCTSLSNPTVSAATAAALGVLTPMPCIPVVPAPWSPGSASAKLVKMAALTSNSTCTCTWGGTISFSSAAQAAMTC